MFGSARRLTALACLLLGAGPLLSACGAPRDPDLERRVLEARAKATKKQADRRKANASPTPTPSPPKTPRPTPTRTYSGEEMDRILATIEGDGPRLVATIATTAGTIECELDETRAPQTVLNFVGLANGVVPWRPDGRGAPKRSKFYEGLTFHRVVNNFVIQTGNPTGAVAGGPGYVITRESGAASHFDKPGALAMIDKGEHTHGSQFFITAKPTKNMANRYAAFGHCKQIGLVRKIANAEKLPKTEAESSPTRAREPVEITSIGIARTD